MDVCVYNIANSTTAKSSPCALDQTCGLLKTALEAGKLEPGKQSQYQYCAVDNGVFGTQGGNCAQCLQVSPGQKYISNCVSLDLTGMSFC